jgi:hypothetical protein
MAGMPRSFRALALALVTPTAWRSRIVGRMSAAWFFKLPGLPSLTPRALAAARAALVRAEIMRRSSSATIAMMPTVSRLADGISAATNPTPAMAPDPFTFA